MFYFLKIFWGAKNNFYLIPILITIISIVLILSPFLIFYNRLPDKLPLFYSLPWGGDQLAAKQQFFLLPIILVLICLINSLIASQLHSVQYVLKRILTISLILIDIIVLITAIKIMWIFI